MGLAKGFEPNLNAQGIRQKTIWSGRLMLGQGQLLGQIGFKYTGTDCFKPVLLPVTPPHIVHILSQGGVMVETTHGLKIAVFANPLIRASGAPSTDENKYRVYIAEDGFKFLSRNSVTAHNPGNWIEIFQVPMSESVCGYIPDDISSSDKVFQLP